MKAKFILSALQMTLWLGFALPAQAQGFVNLHNFTNAPDGANPRRLAWANNSFYGSTANGGTNGDGTIFHFDTNGLTLTMIYSFTGTTNDGSLPNNLTVDGGVIYGTAYFGGGNDLGQIFTVSTNGTRFTPLYSFGPAPDGHYPLSGLVLDGGTLYGTARSGGTNNNGVLFKVGTNGTGYTIIHWFTGTPDGGVPQSEPLPVGGTLFGTTLYGGAGNKGAVYSVNTNGDGYTILHSFDAAPDGNFPYSGLILNGGVLYGATYGGGSNLTGTIFAINPDGSDYKTVYHFSSSTNNLDGSYPRATLTSSGGYLFGTTSSGGSGTGGTVFLIGTNGTGFAVLHSFTTNSVSGHDLESGVLRVGSHLWGATYLGGSGGNGVLFNIQLPAITLPPQSFAVSNGSPAAFIVIAADDAPLHYQWFFNTNTLAGQTNNILSLPSVTTNDAGTYLVVVADGFGTATSSPALLTILLPPVPHGATGTLIVSNGIVIGVNLTDPGYGYTNVPSVHIVGGGGSGAQAVAVVSNGVVVGINLINGGTGYTNGPQLVIGPPFVPQPVLGIAPATFLAFSNLAVGGNYQLQKVLDAFWSNQSAGFTAGSLLYTQPVSGVAAAGDYRLALDPAPTQADATASVSNGLLVAVNLVSGGAGYFSSPSVQITGGGGSNALVVAQTSGGVVTNLGVINPGAGYTNPPFLLIGPPPAAAVWPALLPGMRVDAANLLPFEDYQIQFAPTPADPWMNWGGGLFTPVAITNSQFLLVTNPLDFFRLLFVP